VILTRLSLTSYRNLAAQTVALGERTNVFWGDNGQGKTNLLEAVYLLGTLRSFRAGLLRELIAWGQTSPGAPPGASGPTNGAQVRANVVREGIERTVQVTLREGRRTAEIDGKAVRTAAQFARELAVVLFTPDDLALFRGPPSARRRFLDRAVFGTAPEHLHHVQSYEAALKARNALLQEPSVAPALLDTYDEELARHAAPLEAARLGYLARLEPYFVAAASDLLGPCETTRARVELIRSPADGDLLAALRERRAVDRARAQTTRGPHRDDLRVLLDGREAAEHASQGQTRALVLALKIAEILLLREVRGEAPVLLLDDVSSELDPHRRQALFTFVRELDAQTLVTATRPEGATPDGENTLLFRVDNGVVGQG
jgi:DNA replication and repair protein RecF